MTLDGLDIGDVLRQGKGSPHQELVLFDNEDVVAIRTQQWKYVVRDYCRSYLVPLEDNGYPQLYDMQVDPSESYSMSARQPEILRQMQRRLQQARDTFIPLKSKDLPKSPIRPR